ncbi:Hypothetical predicted protein [Olea europaea subsp. europaea]|uniref:Uncharacterized protein n=1 Tax=Olea europaea subsp. europaea TaxID=158383 RepID=A0A8S0RKN6_OLEEU|nr:Hypothetical predicted protein [Olea europaea subsp. europaea]
MVKDAATGSRLPAPGSKEVVMLDLGASCDIFSCRFCFVCSSSQSAPGGSCGAACFRINNSYLQASQECSLALQIMC